MKKKLIFLAYLVASLLLLYFGLGWFGVFKVYSIPTTSGEPNLNVGSKVIVSNLSKPELGKIMVYKNIDSFPKINYFTFRLCGMPGDTVQIKNGVLFVNGKNFDEGLSLHHAYTLEFENNAQLGKELSENENISVFMQVQRELYYIHTDEKTAAAYGAKRFIQKPDEPDKYVEAIYNQPWNNNHFGPLVIPEGKFFLLGDSRDNAMDSRQVGLIDKDAWVGNVVYH